LEKPVHPLQPALLSTSPSAVPTGMGRTEGGIE
jgi:hypothetical protein